MKRDCQSQTGIKHSTMQLDFDLKTHVEDYIIDWIAYFMSVGAAYFYSKGKANIISQNWIVVNRNSRFHVT